MRHTYILDKQWSGVERSELLVLDNQLLRKILMVISVISMVISKRFAKELGMSVGNHLFCV